MSLHVNCSHATSTDQGSPNQHVLRKQFLSPLFKSHNFFWDNEMLVCLQVTFLSPITLLEDFIAMAWLCVTPGRPGGMRKLPHPHPCSSWGPAVQAQQERSKESGIWSATTSFDRNCFSCSYSPHSMMAAQITYLVRALGVSHILLWNLCLIHLKLLFLALLSESCI